MSRILQGAECVSTCRRTRNETCGVCGSTGHDIRSRRRLCLLRSLVRDDEEVVCMTMTDIRRRDAVLREVDLLSRRRASGKADRRAAVLRVSVALRLAAALPPPPVQ